MNANIIYEGKYEERERERGRERETTSLEL